MTVSEILPSLKQLNRFEKMRVVQILIDEIAEEEILFAQNQNHEFYSQYEAFSASETLLKMLEEEKANA